MLKTSLIAAIGFVVALTSAIAVPAWAQVPPDADTRAITERNDRAFGERAQQNRGRRANSNSQSASTAPSPEEVLAAAQAQATAAGVDCQVTTANLLGVTPEQVSMYEAACQSGPGYILIASTPPEAVDCVLLAGQAEIDRMRDPAAVLGTQCAIPQNVDVLRVVAAYATEAAVPCAADQGASIGKSNAGNLIYEVGCAGVDGFWLERETAGWKKTECGIIITQNATCRYSTTAEQAATLKTRVAGSEAAACDVTEGRYMGANANGAFWEAKCGAGNGVIVRFDPQYAVQQVYPCETAQRIGGGCRLTIVPEAPAAAAPATE